MLCKVTYIEEHRIVETCYVGTPLMEELQTIALETLAVAKQKETLRLLGNCHEMAQGCSEMDIYSLIKFFESLSIDQRIKEAMLLSPLQKGRVDMDLYETMARNRGYNVRVFFDRESAIQWLIS
jgi:hypothetical protein